MLDVIKDNAELKEYTGSFQSGEILFLEGDDSQDLYVLLSGQLDILKGNNTIAEITEPGELFGEMSFLMGTRRTATVKAKSEGQFIRIPREEISEFLVKFPDMSKKITRLLARRLDETSQILFGLKEFCDQLPDAVILTDREGKILTWNTVAEKMYGRTWSEMHYRSAEEIYEEPEEYKSYIDEVQSRYSVREKILKIRHPEKGIRYISTSTTVLYDGHHNYQGLLFLGRDVTHFKEIETRYRRIRHWIAPSLIILCLIAAGAYLLFSHFSGDPQTLMDTHKQMLRNQLGKDFLLLKSLLIRPLRERDKQKTHSLMKEFFDIQESGEIPYRGLVLLDDKLTVFDAYSPGAGEKEAAGIIGSSYGGIDFQGNEDSLHRVLTLYRTDADHPMGRKGVEVAFEIREEDTFLGWLIFQMDMELLDTQYGMTEADLKKMRFRK